MALATVTISPKFQVVLPKETRSKMGLKAGQKMVVLEKSGQVVFCR